MSTQDRLPPRRAVVVGVDGSASALAAVDVATAEARRRGLPLRVVHAFIWPYLRVSLEPSPGGPPEGGLRHDAERTVAEAVTKAIAAAPDVPVHGDVITGTATAVLRELSRTAAVVVLGDRGLGGFTGLLIGSVAVQLAAHAAGPLLVARPATEPAGPVLLGADGSPANEGAVGFAFEEAALRRVPLVAVHAWTRPMSARPGGMSPLAYDVPTVEDEETRVLAEALAGWAGKYPDVVVRRKLVRRAPRRALIEASRRAQLLVVGTRGRGGFTGLLLGSTSQALLHHAACPVAVVPH
jgi:nucleotide-binding universal stress UspA family protein